MADDAEDKTEEPSERKLSKAREEGQVFTSPEVKTWASLAGALVVVGMLGPGLAADFRKLMLPLIDHPHAFAADGEALRQMLATLGWGVIKLLLFPMLVMMVLGVAAAVAQHGWLFTISKIAPDFGKMNPLEGLKRMISPKQAIELAKSLAKLAVVAVVMGLMLWNRMPDFATMATLDLGGALAYLHDRVFSLMLVVLILVSAVAGGDFFWQRWQFNQKMRMTKQEVKDEHKQSEGDPMIKSRMRALRQQRARVRMMAAVPAADVVVTNPTHYAVALKYDMEAMGAPILVAKGVDLVALRIKDLANENEVPVVENPPLARALYASVELDQEVPPEHYKAVAEVIGYVMRLKGKFAR